MSPSDPPYFRCSRTTINDQRKNWAQFASCHLYTLPQISTKLRHIEKINEEFQRIKKAEDNFRLLVYYFAINAVAREITSLTSSSVNFPSFTNCTLPVLSSKIKLMVILPSLYVQKKVKKKMPTAK